MRSWVRFVAGFAATLVAVFMLAAPAMAQEDYPPPDGEAAGPDTVVQGTDVTFVGEGFEPGTEVEGTVEIVSPEGETFVLSETLTANEEGTARLTFEVPCTVMQGDQGTVTFTGTDESGVPLTVSEDFTVAGEAAVCPSGLPTTGANVTNGLLIVAAVIILGAGLVMYSRRRGNEHAEQG